ncbi:MAG: glycosyltransferase family 2 protein [Acidimicrobiales bacterium]
MNPARLTMVIVAFHRPRELQRLLMETADEAIDVVVVNVETDVAVAAVVAEAGPEVREVTTATNVGYAAAVNLGAAQVGTDVVIYTNDDVRMTSADLLALADAIASDEADVVVPRVRNAASVCERTIAALPTPRALLLEWALLPDAPIPTVQRLVDVEKWRMPERPEPIDAAAGIVVATRTDLLRRLPLPEDYFLYWEEMEWFWQVRASGATVQFRPETTIVHSGGREDVRGDKSRLLSRNAIRCVRRTQGRRAALVAIPIVILWNARLVVTAAARLIVGPSREGRRVLRARASGLGAALVSWREVL